MPNVTHKFQEELASGNKKENVKKKDELTQST